MNSTNKGNKPFVFCLHFKGTRVTSSPTFSWAQLKVTAWDLRAENCEFTMHSYSFSTWHFSVCLIYTLWRYL